MIALLLVLLVGVGGSYLYLQYRWGEISSAACASCVAPASGSPYNVLLIGSDSRAGEPARDVAAFGSPQATTGQRSDTLKIVHVDPATGTASTLSIPRDTYVTLSGQPASSQLASANKINAAFGAGPEATVETIERTFGIPISHYIVVNFFGLQDAVNALGGISMDFPYPARDRDCSTGVCYDNSGLDISNAGCQVLDGAQALSLSRSRYYQYFADGYWHSDPTSDIGRIERQNLVISAVLDRAKATYNPLKLNGLLGSVVHDFSKDNGLTPQGLLSLALRYHALSGSRLAAYILPTSPAQSPVAGDVEVVDTQAAQTLITQFLGTTPDPASTPPLDGGGNPMPWPAPVPTPVAAASGSSGSSPSSGGGGTTTATQAGSSGAAPVSSIPSYDPHSC